MSLYFLTGAVLGGYLLGSISWSRIIARWASPEKTVREFRYQVPGSDEMITSDTVSATSVRAQLGPVYGCLTALLDMAKVALPVFLLKRLFPQEPYFIAAAASGVIGHNWPIFYRFKGGRGASPIMGGLLVLDPIGLVAVLAGGSVLGLIVGHMLVLRWSWLVLMLPWFWFRTGSWLYVGYAIICNAAYWLAMAPEIRQYNSLKARPSQEEMSRFFSMGSKPGRWMDKFSILAAVRRLRRKKIEQSK